jgi:colanic acid biosynthesis glycosyl transferase WcaI
VRKREVEQTIRDHDLKNMLSLPYEPLSMVRYSLSAADVHLVSMDDNMVGVIHPCKIYGAMSVARPILLVGPAPSHASDLVDQNDIGWHIAHGDVAGAEKAMREVLNINPKRLEEMGSRALGVVKSELSKKYLCGAFCDVLERSTSQPAAPQFTHEARSAQRAGSK